MCGGSSKTSSTSTPQMPAWMSARMQEESGRAEALGKTPFQAYGGQMTAGMTGAQQSAMAGMQGLANYNVLDGVGNNGSIAGMDLSGYMNPFTNDVINATYADMDANTAKSLTAAGGAGTLAAGFGGSGDRAAVERAGIQSANDRAKASVGAQLRAQNVQNAQGLASGDLNRMLQGRTTNAGLQTNANQMLFGMGSAEQQVQQADLDAKYNEFMRELNDPFQKLTFESGVTTGTAPFFTSTKTESKGPSQGMGSMLGGLGGLAMGAAMLMNSGGVVPGYTYGGRAEPQEDDDGAGGAFDVFSPSDQRMIAALDLLQGGGEEPRVQLASADPRAELPGPGSSGLAGAPDFRGNNQRMAAERERIFAMPPEQQPAALAALSAQHAKMNSGLPANVPYRAAQPDGEGGQWDANLPAPNGAVPAFGPDGPVGSAGLGGATPAVRLASSGGGEPTPANYAMARSPANTQENRPQAVMAGPAGEGLGAAQPSYAERVLAMLQGGDDRGPEPDDFFGRLSYRMNDPNRAFARFLLHSGIGMLANAQQPWGVALGQGLAHGMSQIDAERGDRENARIQRMNAGARLIQQERLAQGNQGTPTEIERLYRRIGQLRAAGQGDSEEARALAARAQHLGRGEQTGLTPTQRVATLAGAERDARAEAAQLAFTSEAHKSQWIAATTDRLFRDRMGIGNVEVSGEPVRYTGPQPMLRSEVPNGMEPDGQGGYRVRPDSRPLSGTEMRDFRDAGTQRNTFMDLLQTFDDSFAGKPLVGGVQNTIGGMAGANTPEWAKQSEWWANYRLWANGFRNSLFGATLTPAEIRAFEQATVSQSMDPARIRNFLRQQQGIIESGIRRNAEALAEQGSMRRPMAAAVGVPYDWLFPSRTAGQQGSQQGSQQGGQQERQTSTQPPAQGQGQGQDQGQQERREPAQAGGAVRPGDVRTAPSGRRVRFKGGNASDPRSWDYVD